MTQNGGGGAATAGAPADGTAVNKQETSCEWPPACCSIIPP
jgi:hypothetical protein